MRWGCIGGLRLVRAGQQVGGLFVFHGVMQADVNELVGIKRDYDKLKEGYDKLVAEDAKRAAIRATRQKRKAEREAKNTPLPIPPSP